MHRTTLAVVTSCTLALHVLPAQAPAGLPDDRAAGAATITEADLKDWLTTLTSEEFGGRGTGQVGFRLAAEFVRDHFESLGLEPGGDQGTFWQHVPWRTVTPDADRTWLAVLDGDRELLRIPASRMAGRVSLDSDSRGELLLIVPQEWEQPGEEGGRFVVPRIAGLDQVAVEDRLLLVVLPEGRQARMAQFGVLQQLTGKGAAGVLFVEQEASGGLRGQRGAGRRAGNRALQGRQLRPATVTIGRRDAAAILAAAGQVEAALAGDELAVPLGKTGHLQIRTTTDERPAYNVIGILPGRDPGLRDEYVVIGSHLDHLGRRGDRYFPGADDDGSGSVAVMALARAFAKNRVRPRRSVLFVTFCGEESGLVGSRYFVEHPPVPLASIVAELQMDMIGRDEESSRTGERAEDNRNSLHLVGTQRLSRDLHELCLSRNELAGFDLEWDEEDVFSRSDHANFAAKGIPIAFFFTGFHPDYHQTTDTVDKIHFAKVARVARYVYDIAFELAQAEGRPLVDADLWAKNRGGLRGASAEPAAPVRKK